LRKGIGDQLHALVGERFDRRVVGSHGDGTRARGVHAIQARGTYDLCLVPKVRRTPLEDPFGIRQALQTHPLAKTKIPTGFVRTRKWTL